jgi:hypothetical protein
MREASEVIEMAELPEAMQAKVETEMMATV